MGRNYWRAGGKVNIKCKEKSYEKKSLGWEQIISRICWRETSGWKAVYAWEKYFRKRVF